MLHHIYCFHVLKSKPKDLETFLEELSAFVPHKELIETYHLATQEPYTFLYINLVAPKLNDTFFINFTQNIEV